MLSSTFLDIQKMPSDNIKGEKADPLQNQLCRVCEEPAAGFHFGAFTCEGCKSFFGRSCNNQSVIQDCKNNYRCVVDKKNRTACKACRLRKCLMVGMSKSGSRYGRRSNWFKIHCLMQQQNNSPPAKPQSAAADPILPPQAAAWVKTEDNPAATPKDSSFASSNSRSPSPANSSFEGSSSSAKAESPASPTSGLKLDGGGAVGGHPLLAHLYNPLLLAHHGGAAFPFYKLPPPPPTLLTQNPFLSHPALLLSLNNQHRSHLELMQEHQELLSRFSAVAAAATPDRESPASAASSSTGDDENSERSTSPAAGPMDLSLKVTSSLLAPPRFPPVPKLPAELAERFRREFLPPLKVQPPGEGWNPSLLRHNSDPGHPNNLHPDSDPEEEDGKSDNNRNNLHATNFEENRDALDLSVNS